MVTEALKIEGLSNSFGALRVLKDVNLIVNANERLAVIGPNGAGKTTLINIITGELTASTGRIYVFGEEVTNMPVHRRVHIGLAHSFQITRVFARLTVLENVLLALQGTRPSRYQMFRPSTAYEDLMAEAQKLLKTLNLWEKSGKQVHTISYGEKRRLEIALSLALRPKILLLDEPSAGLDTHEIPEFVNMIKALSKDVTVIFSAHDMEVVFGLASRVAVLYYGQFIANGTCDEIRVNPAVREIYLGVEEN